MGINSCDWRDVIKWLELKGYNLMLQTEGDGLQLKGWDLMVVTHGLELKAKSVTIDKFSPQWPNGCTKGLILKCYNSIFQAESEGLQQKGWD